MKKLIITYVCVFIIFMFASCDIARNNVDKEATVEINTNITAESNDFIEGKVNKELISRIEVLEKEIIFLKEALYVKNQKPDNHGAIINALGNMHGRDNIYLGIDQEGEYVTAVYIKIPNEIDISYEFYLLTGSEIDGVPLLNSLIKPYYIIVDKFKEYGIDKEKFEIRKLPLKLKYDETTVFLIIMIDSKGNEYSDYVHSLKFMSDI